MVLVSAYASLRGRWGQGCREEYTYRRQTPIVL